MVAMISVVCFATILHFSTMLSVLLKILQIPWMVRNMEPEKQTRRRKVTPLGRPSRRGLCWAVKSSRASAWIPHLSSVQDVRKSHCCFCSHHNAWSDQSCWISNIWGQNIQSIIQGFYSSRLSEYTYL